MKPLSLWLAGLSIFIFDTSTFAQDAAGEARAASRCTARHADFYDRQEKEIDDAIARLEKIKGDPKKVCEFGRSFRIPLFERQLAELRTLQSSSCFDNIDRDQVQRAEKRLPVHYSTVESDCKKAGSIEVRNGQGQAAQAAVGPCGTIITSKYEKVGFGEQAQCILVANKCAATINFRVSSSTVANTKLAETVKPGETGKICATKESEKLTYLGWKYEKERWPR